MQVLVLHLQFLQELLKKLLKAIRNKKKKHNKIVKLARRKLNTTESKTSEALIISGISHEDFMIIINEEEKCRKLKESNRMLNSQRSDTEKINLIEEGKTIDIGEVFRQREIINKSLKSSI